jgi:hypothetical protein
MLTDVQLVSDPIIEMICTVDEKRVEPIAHPEAGVYIFEHFNPGYQLGVNDLEYDYQYPRVEPSSYGVCDNWEQLKAALSPFVFEPGRNFVIALTLVKREDQSSEGGWRYHKWGPYIGVQGPSHEYLYDDKHIDQVYCWHIYELP